MSISNLDSEPVEPDVNDIYLPEDSRIQPLMESVIESHDLLYQLINLESWALASSMDEFIPGFWSRFLENRRRSLKDFINHKHPPDMEQKRTSVLFE
jgi:hypothetical protein